MNISDPNEKQISIIKGAEGTHIIKTTKIIEIDMHMHYFFDADGFITTLYVIEFDFTPIKLIKVQKITPFKSQRPSSLCS